MKSKLFNISTIFNLIALAIVFITALFAMNRLQVDEILPISNVVLAAIATGLAVLMMVYVQSGRKNTRTNIEHGSARWGRSGDIANYKEKDERDNIILTNTESLSMNSRPKDVKYARNKNVLVIGGAGSGKTYFFMKPNIMQCDSEKYPVSFVITDPKGLLVEETGTLLQDHFGYKVKVLNTINFKKSLKYNPLLCY